MFSGVQAFLNLWSLYSILNIFPYWKSLLLIHHGNIYLRLISFQQIWWIVDGGSCIVILLPAFAPVPILQKQIEFKLKKTITIWTHEAVLVNKFPLTFHVLKARECERERDTWNLTFKFIIRIWEFSFWPQRSNLNSEIKGHCGKKSAPGLKSWQKKFYLDI